MSSSSVLTRRCYQAFTVRQWDEANRKLLTDKKSMN
jgi:hypothetical protein